ncbi:MAG: hypothetical protein PVF05_07195 [Gemmatimonadales bacterium]
MTSFARELRRLAGRLDVPQPKRADIVRELDHDLAALALELERRGYPRAAARRRAVEILMPGSPAVEELNAFHRPLYLRLVDRFSDPSRNRLERGLFGATLVLVATLGALGLGGLDLLEDPSPATIPLLGLGLATLAIVPWKLFLLHIRRDGDSVRLSRGLGWLPTIAVGTAIVVFAGLAFDLYATAGQLVGNGADAGIVLLAWLRRDMAMASLGLLVGALTLGSWLWLSAGVARVARAESELERDLVPLRIIDSTGDVQ